MKYILKCEGSNEYAVVSMLLNHDKLILNKDDLLSMQAYAVHKLTNPYIYQEIKNYNKPLIIYSIGDTLKETIKIPKEFSNIINSNDIKKYCTKPEIEILLIINEGLLKQYDKTKSKISPKEFAKKNIKFNGKKYDNSRAFWENYYAGRIDTLVSNIRAYKQYKKHDKGELFLADLLKNDN